MIMKIGTNRCIENLLTLTSVSLKYMTILTIPVFRSAANSEVRRSSSTSTLAGGGLAGTVKLRSI